MQIDLVFNATMIHYVHGVFLPPRSNLSVPFSKQVMPENSNRDRSYFKEKQRLVWEVIIVVNEYTHRGTRLISQLLNIRSHLQRVGNRKTSSP